MSDTVILSRADFDKLMFVAFFYRDTLMNEAVVTESIAQDIEDIDQFLTRMREEHGEPPPKPDPDTFERFPCPGCGLPVPLANPPESRDEALCDACYEAEEPEDG